MQRLTREAAAPEPNHVEPTQVTDHTDRKRERDDVVAQAGHARDHRVRTDAGELVDRRQTANEHMIADGAMSAERGGIGEGHVMADLAVVGDMGIRHEEPAVAHFRYAAAVLGADVHRHALANLAIGANDKTSRPAAVFDRLRRRAGLRGRHFAAVYRGHDARLCRGSARRGLPL